VPAGERQQWMRAEQFCTLSTQRSFHSTVLTNTTEPVAEFDK